MDADALPPGAGARERGRSDPVRLLATLGVATGLIHILAMGEHLREGALYVVFFAVVAAGQLGWGTWMYRHPGDRRRLVAGAAANCAVIVIWTLSRTVGVPLLSQVGRPEAIGLIDAVATLYELAIVAFAIAMLRPAGRVGVRLSTLSAEQQTRITAALVAATVSALLLGSHAH